MQNYITIKSDSVTAKLAPDFPRLLSVNNIRGYDPLTVRVYELNSQTYHADDVTIDCSVTTGRNFASYLTTVSIDSTGAAQFNLRFLAQDDRLIVTCEFLEEYSGFQLMNVRMPLVSASGTESTLALPLKGGRLIDISASEPHEQIQMAHCDELPLVAMLREGNEAVLLEAGSLDDNVISSVNVDNDAKVGALGINFTHRYGPQNKDIPAFKVTNRTEAFLTFFGANGNHWWVDGAKMLRKKVNTSIPPLYDGAMIYKMKLDEPQFDDTEYTTFDEAIERIKRISNYSAGAKQIAYLNGWQHKGHDTGYPDVFTVNERLGGLDKFRNVIDSGQKYNAVVSFHDNYDDAYTSSPMWDKSIIATDENGGMKAGGVWGGGQAYIISPHKYIEHARKRLNRTIDMCGVSKTIHVDVFSVVPDRYDFDPDNPAGFAKSAEAKNYIVRLFRERGLDMTSEGICSAFVGNINYGWHFPDGDDRFFSAEEDIPLLPFIYHGKVIGAGGIKDDRHLLKHLLWGLAFCTDIRKKTDLKDYMELYYLLYVPFFQLASRTMQSYETAGDSRTVRYDGNTWINIDYGNNRYEVVVDGAVVAKNFVTTSPMPQGGWIVYSRDNGPVTIALPDNVHKVSVKTLSEQEPAEYSDYMFKNSTLCLDAASKTPYYIVSL